MWHSGNYSAPSFGLCVFVLSLVVAVIHGVTVPQNSETILPSTELPSSMHQRLGRKKRLPQNQFDIRYLCFGGISTWGVGLESPHPIHTWDATTGILITELHEAAYPYRLSVEAHNAAQRVGGPTLAALCTQSLVDDDNGSDNNDDDDDDDDDDNNNNYNNEGIYYDVITVEFSNANSPLDLKATELLVQRLRRRFPKAVIILVQLWSPAYFYYLEDDRMIDFASWRVRQQQKSAWNSTDWHGALSQHEWKYSSQVGRTTIQLQALAQELDGHLVHLAPPQDPIYGLETANKWFLELAASENSPPEYTLSTRGHMVVATHIRSFVDLEKISTKSMDERNTLGDWGSGDSCHLWYDYDPDREHGLTSIPTHSSNILVQEFSRGNLALELTTQGGSIVVQNPFHEDRTLYLTYISETSSSETKTFPRVQTWLDGMKGTIIDPRSSDKMVEGRHNTTRTSAIGIVAANSFVEVRLKPLDDGYTNFRLIGASFLTKDEAQWLLEPELDLLVVTKTDMDSA